MTATRTDVLRLAALLCVRILAAHTARELARRALVERDEHARAGVGPEQSAEDDCCDQSPTFDAPILEQMGYPAASKWYSIWPLSSNARQVVPSERAYAIVVLGELADFVRRQRSTVWALVSLRHGRSIEDRAPAVQQ